MIVFSEQLAVVFNWLVRASAQACVLVLLIVIIQAALRHKLSPRWRYMFGLLIIVRLLLPWAPESKASVYNLFSYAQRGAVPQEIPESMSTVDRAPLLIESPLFTPAKRNADPGSTDSEGPALVSLSQSGASTGKRGLIMVMQLLPLVWLAGVMVFAGGIIIQGLMLAAAISRRRFVTDQETLELLEDCKTEMGSRAYLALVETPKVKSPSLFGFIRPRLLLPAGVIAALGPQRLRYVFLHELAHLRRHDVLVNWLMTILQALHWFNPLVWFAFKQMRADRELACDALVLSRTASSEQSEYGKTIIELLQNFTEARRLPNLAGILEDKKQVKNRIAMIARFNKRAHRLPVFVVLLIVLLVCVGLTNAHKLEIQSEDDTWPEWIVMAQDFVELLAGEDFPSAAEHFEPTMKEAVPISALEQIWRALLQQGGSYIGTTGARTERYFSNHIIYLRCEFQEGPIDVRINYNAERKISELSFTPTSASSLYANIEPWDFVFGYRHIGEIHAQDYLVEQHNVQVYYEWQDPPITYWGPTVNDEDARLTMHFQFERAAKRIHLRAALSSYNFLVEGGVGDGLGQCSLWGSTEGKDWTLLLDVPVPEDTGSDRYYQKILPLEFSGASELWLQIRFRVSGTNNIGYTVAQFSRGSAALEYNIFELKVEYATAKHVEK